MLSSSIVAAVTGGGVAALIIQNANEHKLVWKMFSSVNDDELMNSRPTRHGNAVQSNERKRRRQKDEESIIMCLEEKYLLT